MGIIRIVWGAATGPTAMASYDAALAAADVHNYNLVGVSSVIPADAEVDPVGEAPDLGPAGERLTAVEGRKTVPPGSAEPAVAGLGWDREPDGPGIFYETTGTDADSVRDDLEEGLAAGRALREWAFGEADRRLVAADPDSETYATAVVLAVYGRSSAIV